MQEGYFKVRKPSYINYDDYNNDNIYLPCIITMITQMLQTDECFECFTKKEDSMSKHLCG